MAVTEQPSPPSSPRPLSPPPQHLISPPSHPAAPPKPSRTCGAFPRPAHRLTLLGRCVALLGGEVVANAALWITAACVFGPQGDKRGVLSLCVVAWTLGLRHGLDMDHIVAIDVTTRSLVAMGQRPVTVGLWFSLGHSSIVLAATLAIIITVRAIDKLPDVAAVGGTIGVCVSASFLFLLAVINAVMLYQTVRMARRRKQLRAACAAADTSADAGVAAADLTAAPSIPSSGPPLSPALSAPELALSKKLSYASALEREDEEAAVGADTDAGGKRDERSGDDERDLVMGLPPTTCIGRVGRPLFRIIDRPWKMYPVGVLFGLGFDTAASISLLGISALAGSGDNRVPAGQIILLPLLFTAGMSAVDSLDSVFMLQAYTVPQRAAAAEAGLLPEKKKERREGPAQEDDGVSAASSAVDTPSPSQAQLRWYSPRRWPLVERRPTATEERDELLDAAERARMLPQASEHTLLNVSVILTGLSILVALLISITEFMGLALEKCASCSEAAENDPGLSGSWWRAWQAINDNAGFLGAGIVALFALVFGVWGVVHWLRRRSARRDAGKERAVE